MKFININTLFNRRNIITIGFFVSCIENNISFLYIKQKFGFYFCIYIIINNINKKNIQLIFCKIKILFILLNKNFSFASNDRIIYEFIFCSFLLIKFIFLLTLIILTEFPLSLFIAFIGNI